MVGLLLISAYLKNSKKEYNISVDSDWFRVVAKPQRATCNWQTCQTFSKKKLF